MAELTTDACKNLKNHCSNWISGIIKSR